MRFYNGSAIDINQCRFGWQHQMVDYKRPDERDLGDKCPVFCNRAVEYLVYDKLTAGD